MNGYCVPDCSGGGLLTLANSITRTCEYGACHPKCYKCNGSLQNNCTACDVSSNFPYLLGTSCESSCPIGYYEDIV